MRVEREQSALARARELRADGLTLTAVSARLAEEGHTARNGRAFGPSQVWRLVRDVERKEDDTNNAA